MWWYFSHGIGCSIRMAESCDGGASLTDGSVCQITYETVEYARLTISLLTWMIQCEAISLGKFTRFHWLSFRLVPIAKETVITEFEGDSDAVGRARAFRP